MATAVLPVDQPTGPKNTVVDSAGDDLPNVVPASYARNQTRWTKCRALMGGTEAIRDGGETYLPKLEGESTTRYNVRKVLASVFNAFARTVKASVGMLLQQEPQLGETMPQTLVDLWENIDGAGTHGSVFTRNLATTGIVDGLAGILTEKQRIEKPEAVSADDEQRLGLRPYWILVRADDVIRQFYRVVNGRRTLTLLIIREVTDELRPGRRFVSTSVTRFRVYTRVENSVSAEIWETPENGGPPVQQGQPVILNGLTAIPWAPFIAGEEMNGIGSQDIKPPLLDLAELNITHHQVNTNKLSLETLAMVPTLVRIGATPDKDGVYPGITLGPRDTIEVPLIEGVQQPVYWLSPAIDVLEPAEKTLDRLEGAMSKEGGAFLAPDPNGVESAEAKRIKGAAQRATLSTVSRALQDCLETAFMHTAAYMKTEAGTVQLNRDFEQTEMDPETMLAYVSAVSDAGLPIRILLQAWQKGGRIPEDADLEELEGEMVAQLAANQKQKQLEAALQAETGNGGEA